MQEGEMLLDMDNLVSTIRLQNFDIKKNWNILTMFYFLKNRVWIYKTIVSHINKKTLILRA